MKAQRPEGGNRVSKVLRKMSSEMQTANIGAQIITYTIFGVPYYYSYSITGPRTLFILIIKAPTSEVFDLQRQQADHASD